MTNAPPAPSATPAARPSTRRTRVLGLGALVLPFLAAPLVTRALAEHLGEDVGQGLAESAGSLSEPPPLEPVVLGGAFGVGDEAEVPPHYFSGGLVMSGRAPGTPPARTDPEAIRRGASPRGRVSGLLIPAATVVRAAQAGARPIGVPAPPSGRRPAGLSLGGVSGYGSGLSDGDVLTHIAGTPASSEGTVVAAITRAVEARVPAISAEVWRRDQRMIVTVEIPAIDDEPREPRRRRARKPPATK